jgi:hypothetical protein
MTANAALSMNLNASQSGANAFGGPFWNAALAFSSAFGNGLGAKQLDIVYVAERTVAASTNDDIDVSGVLTDAFGATIAAVELAAVVIINAPKDPAAAANTSSLTVGGAAAPVPGFAAAIVPIEPGGMFSIVSPGAAGLATVVATTADKIRVANGAGGTAKYQIALLARSA